MAGSVNKVILLGHVGRDPDIRSTQDGRRIANLSLATSETWTDKNSGERKERTEWTRVVVFNDGLVDVIEKYVHKGSKLYVEGALQTRKWTDNVGVEKYSTEVVIQAFRGQIVLLGDHSANRAPPAESADEYGQESTRQSRDYAARHSAPPAPELEDDIPF